MVMRRLVLAVVVVAALAGTARAETVVVEMQGFRNDKGSALVSLFASKDGYPEQAQKAVRKVVVPIQKGSAKAVLKDVPPGTYAVAVMHDEDNDRKLKKGMFGIPKEGIGASNNARGHFGPPKFDDAKFELRPGRTITTRIRLIYY
jgi:uncharacterized protein (DUF2141 family)